MSDALLVSKSFSGSPSWSLAGVVAALARQIGVLYERVAPAGALMAGRGPRVGEAAPVLRRRGPRRAARATVGGRATTAGARSLFFLSPTCPVCKTLLPALRSVARRERGWLDVVLASDGPRAEHEPFVAAQRSERSRTCSRRRSASRTQVGKLPYAVLIDGDGMMRAKGLVNTREHLESLFEAQRAGRGLAPGLSPAKTRRRR